MRSNGYIVFFFMLISWGVYAQENYFIPGEGQVDEAYTEDSESEQGDYFIPNTLKGQVGDENLEESTWFLLGEGDSKLPQELESEEISEESNFLMTGTSKQEYSELKGKKLGTTLDHEEPYERLRGLRNDRETAYTLTILYDGTDYEDSRGVYDRSFGGDDAKWYNSVWAILSSEFYLIKAPIFSFALGANLGAGYKSGYGKFVGREENSQTKFTLLTLPLDLSLVAELNFSHLVKVQLFGGPSAMFLVQSRDDREGSEEDKTIGQASLGYFAGTRLKMSLGKLFPASNQSMFLSNDVTNYFMTFDIRYQSYTNFKQEDIKLSGFSAGIGFAFEFL
jgi:hypothetical protein